MARRLCLTRPPMLRHTPSLVIFLELDMVTWMLVETALCAFEEVARRQRRARLAPPYAPVTARGRRNLSPWKRLNSA